MNKIFIVCTGLGRINRGYETFSQECFDVLKNEPEFDMYLFKGAGPESEKEKVVLNLHRHHFLANFFAKLIGKDAYFVEQFTFFLSFVWSLFKYKPSVVFYSDFILGTFLWNFRRLTGLKYKLLFSNGAPNGPPFSRCDLVQQLLPFYYNIAIQAGEPVSNQYLLPYGFAMPETRSESKTELRTLLGIPQNSFVILSVGAINASHKRMDYLIDEIACLGRGDVYLILLGQNTSEMELIEKLARENLGDSFLIKNVTYDQVSHYYYLSDLFVLCSLTEGFGRVYIEALSYGLPVIAHDYLVAREVMGDCATYVDMNVVGDLKNELSRAVLEGQSVNKKEQNITFVKQNYAWDKLKDRYVEMIKKLL